MASSPWHGIHPLGNLVWRVKFKDLLHEHDATIDPRNLANAGNAPLAIRKPVHLYNNFDRGSDLRPDAVLRHWKAGHTNHLF